MLKLQVLGKDSYGTYVNYVILILSNRVTREVKLVLNTADGASHTGLSWQFRKAPPSQAFIYLGLGRVLAAASCSAIFWIPDLSLTWPFPNITGKKRCTVRKNHTRDGCAVYCISSFWRYPWMWITHHNADIFVIESNCGPLPVDNNYLNVKTNNNRWCLHVAVFFFLVSCHIFSFIFLHFYASLFVICYNTCKVVWYSHQTLNLVLKFWFTVN